MPNPDNFLSYMATYCPTSTTLCPSWTTSCPTLTTLCPTWTTLCPTWTTSCSTRAASCPTWTTLCPTLKISCSYLNIFIFRAAAWQLYFPTWTISCRGRLQSRTCVRRRRVEGTIQLTPGYINNIIGSLLVVRFIGRLLGRSFCRSVIYRFCVPGHTKRNSLEEVVDAEGKDDKEPASGCLRVHSVSKTLPFPQRRSPFLASPSREYSWLF